jgi:hypothetical protein
MELNYSHFTLYITDRSQKCVAFSFNGTNHFCGCKRTGRNQDAAVYKVVLQVLRTLVPDMPVYKIMCSKFYGCPLAWVSL